MSKLKILFIASECASIAKVGGLADVVGSLPKTLKKTGIDVSIVLPFYEIISRKDRKLKLVYKNISVNFDGTEKKFCVWKTFLENSKVPVFLIDNKEYFKGRGVYIEEDASSGGSKEEAARFLFLSVAGIKIAQLIKAQIIHCQDWHTAIIPFLLKKDGIKDFKTFLTIHNLAYQGIYSATIVNQLLKTNFSEDINCLKLGVSNADIVNTVSPNYAKEILTKKYGFGLEKDLKKRKDKLIGIINGLDIKTWDPSNDIHLKSQYNIRCLNKKIENKAYLQKKFFKKIDTEIPVIGIVSRLAEQKGFDLIEKIFPLLMKENLNFIILGTGLPRYQNFFQEKARQYPEKLGVKIGFSEELAHQIYAGVDIFLMPSFFEPCGLGQLIAMRYGTVPIVRETGGLKDTVIPIKVKDNKVSGNGFLFKDYKAEEFFKAIKKSLSVFEKNDVWKKIQINGMKQDYSWEKSTKEYLKIYRKLA